MIKNIYTSNYYLEKNPSLHEEETSWKIKKIKPLVDQFLVRFNEKKLRLLDVGGGTGKILKEISEYIEKKHKIKVEKYALDLTPKILELQRKNNSSLRKALNEDISHTSLKKKEIDLVLMIDVLEHIPNPKRALKELNRISDYVIFKVPLEKNLIMILANFLTLGKVRKKIIQRLGHINVYNLRILNKQLENNGFYIISSNYTNSFEYWFNSNRHKNTFLGLPFRIYYGAGYLLSKLFPNLVPILMNDFVMILAKVK